jgi:hypothetical protein
MFSNINEDTPATLMIRETGILQVAFSRWKEAVELCDKQQSECDPDDFRSGTQAEKSERPNSGNTDRVRIWRTGNNPFRSCRDNTGNGKQLKYLKNSYMDIIRKQFERYPSFSTRTKIKTLIS